MSNEAASAESYKAQMAPALRAIGFSNPEIDCMLKFYPGETEKNIQDRLEKTWPIIERKIKTHQKNLSKGINANQNVIGENDVPRSIDQKIARDEQERAQFQDAPDGFTYLYRGGKRYKMPVNEVEEAINKGGFRYEG